jgi:hypothetical protein
MTALAYVRIRSALRLKGSVQPLRMLGVRSDAGRSTVAGETPGQRLSVATSEEARRCLAVIADAFMATSSETAFFVAGYSDDQASQARGHAFWCPMAAECVQYGLALAPQGAPGPLEPPRCRTAAGCWCLVPVGAGERRADFAADHCDGPA